MWGSWVAACSIALQYGAIMASMRRISLGVYAMVGKLYAATV